MVLITWFRMSVMSNLDVRAMHRDTTQTLERINIEALVLPFKVLFPKCLFNHASLCIIWCDYTK